MTTSKSVLFLTVLMVLASSLSEARAQWPQPQGQGYYKLGVGLVQANEFYEPDGRVIDIPTLTDVTASFYGEYGLTDRFTVIAYVPFVQRLTLNRQIGAQTGFVFFEGDEQTSVADANLGIRFGIAQLNSTVISGTLTLGIPIGEDEQANGLLTGDGEFNQHLALGVGHSFYPIPAYLALEAGYNNRTQGFSDEVIYRLEAGYTFMNKLTAIGRLRGLEPMRNGDDATLGGMGGLYANNQRYLAYGFELAYDITRTLGVSLGVESATRGQNILSAAAFSSGLYLKL